MARVPLLCGDMGLMGELKADNTLEVWRKFKRICIRQGGAGCQIKSGLIGMLRQG
jgi:hypothetical protein